MKKSIRNIVLVIIFLLTLLANTATAQIYLMDSDQGDNVRVESDDWEFFLGAQGSDDDQSLYTPLGDGMLVMLGLCGVYLLRNRKRED